MLLWLATPSHAFFTASVSVNPLWDFAQNREISDSFRQFLFSRYVKRDLFHFINFLRISCSPSMIYLFTFCTWRFFFFTFIIWFEHNFDVKLSKLPHILQTFWTTCRYLWTLKYNIKIFWYKVLTFLEF